MIEGKQIILRPLLKTDIDKIVKWQNDPDIYLNTLGCRFPVSENLANQWMENILSEVRNKNIYFGIETRKPRELIGIIQIINIDWISRTGDFGIQIGESSMRGKGYAHEAMNNFFNYLFNIINIRKITLKVVANNKNAVELYKKTGFKDEGRLHHHVYINNKYEDIIIMSLFKDDYLR